MVQQTNRKPREVKFYKPSGIAPVGAVVFTLLAGVLVLPILSVGHCWLISRGQGPSVGLISAFFVSILAGCLIGFVGKLSRVRNPFLISLITLLAVLTGIYFEWAIHPYFVLPAEQRFFAWTLMDIWNWSGELFHNGELVNGWLAVVIWTGEFILIASLSIRFALLQMNQPFCENCQNWTRQRKDIAHLRHPGGWSEIFYRIENADLIAILSLPPIPPRNNHRISVDLHLCNVCLSTGFISCRAIEYVQSKGIQEEKEKELFNHLSITTAELEQLAALGTFEKPTAASTTFAGTN